MYTISNKVAQFIKIVKIMPLILMTLLYSGGCYKPPELKY